jgi:hypothetical protein
MVLLFFLLMLRQESLTTCSSDFDANCEVSRNAGPHLETFINLRLRNLSSFLESCGYGFVRWLLGMMHRTGCWRGQLNDTVVEAHGGQFS